MEEKEIRPPQSSLILRILGGGYLMWLGYDLGFRGETPPSGLVLAAALVFAGVGLALVVLTLRQLLHHEYFYQKDPPGDEEDSEQ